ncbi:MAG TPA: protein kinase [Gemmatales bacterium]|nr:protein kinase [Gemmatales bacterium]
MHDPTQPAELLPPDLSCLQPETKELSPSDNSDGVTTDVSNSMAASTIPPTEKGTGMPERIGDYQILAILGRGGMGVVYQARHVHLDQLFAIKMIRDPDYGGSVASARFLREAQVIADLKHPGIVQVHHFAIHEDHPYLVMEYLPAGSLDKKLKTSLFSPRDAARLVAQLAEALQTAHDKKIIHRDLKPHNVLLTEQGHAKITDFGLARRTDTALTREFSYLGTPPYMSPEQARGDLASVDHRSDVYALGAILYEILTGRPPYRGSNDIETMRLVCESEVVPVRTLQPRVPLDLETICLHCLQKEPAHRYASAQALQKDLQAYLDNQPISVRPISATGKAWRWCKRNPVVAALSGSLAALLIIGCVLALNLAYWAWNEQSRANQELSEKKTALETASMNELKANKYAQEAYEIGLLIERERETFKSIMGYLVDLNLLGRNISKSPLRRDFEMKVALNPLPPTTDMPKPTTQNNTRHRDNGQHEFAMGLLGHRSLVKAMWWQELNQPPIATGAAGGDKFRTNGSIAPGSTGSFFTPPAMSSASPPPAPTTTSTDNTAAVGGQNAIVVNPKLLKPLPTYRAGQRYCIDILPEQDCYLTVFLIKPQQRQCLLIYPNELAPSQLLEKNKEHSLLNDRQIALQPSVSNSPEFLYLIATTSPWKPELGSVTKQGHYHLIKEVKVLQLINGKEVITHESNAKQLMQQLDLLVKQSAIGSTGLVQPSPLGSLNSVQPSPSGNSPVVPVKMVEDLQLFHVFGEVRPAQPMPAEPKKADTKPPLSRVEGYDQETGHDHRQRPCHTSPVLRRGVVAEEIHQSPGNRTKFAEPHLDMSTRRSVAHPQQAP